AHGEPLRLQHDEPGGISGWNLRIEGDRVGRVRAIDDLGLIHGRGDTYLAGRRGKAAHGAGIVVARAVLPLQSEGERARVAHSCECRGVAAVTLLDECGGLSQLAVCTVSECRIRDSWIEVRADDEGAR